MASSDQPERNVPDPESPSPSGDVPESSPSDAENPEPIQEFVDEDILELVDEEEELEELEEVPLEPYVPGPGTGEAIGWTLGVLAIHVAGAMLMLVGIVFYLALSKGPEILSNTSEVEALMVDYLGVILAGEMAVFVIGALIATRLRLGPRTSQRLGLVKASPLHLILLICSVLPMAFLSGQLYQAAMEGWNWLMSQVPGLENAEPGNTVEALNELTQQLPFWALLLAMAVAPAVGEEIIFRGIIGRGLVARMGLRSGILLTSFLFAIVHMHPAHAMGVLPLGIYIHYLHITTRSFWAPVLMHFLNNAWAAFVAKYMFDAEAQTIAEQVSVHPLLLVSAFICVGLICCLLWQTRKIYRLPNGTECTPGYFTVEVPPMKDAERVSVAPASKELLAATFLAIALFFTFAILTA